MSPKGSKGPTRIFKGSQKDHLEPHVNLCSFHAHFASLDELSSTRKYQLKVFGKYLLEHLLLSALLFDDGFFSVAR